MFRRSSLIFLIFTAVILFGFADNLSASEDHWKEQRQVLNYAIECQDNGANCQLINTGESGERRQLVSRGSLEQMEETLVEMLQAQYGNGFPNLPIWTLGGDQFWADVFVYHGWRIQENVFTGHHRLLDAQDLRRAWGSYEACQSAFQTYRRDLKFEPKSNHWVFILHGLFRGKDSVEPLRSELSEAGFEAQTVNYPSTRRSIDEHAEQLATIIKRADGADTVSFVTQSLGGIVVRRLFADADWQENIDIGKIVMVAPPNRGSQVAEALEDFFPFQVLAGESGKALTEEQVSQLPVPDVEIGIIAGQVGGEDGWNPLITGPGDGTISISTTRLENAADFLVVRGMHSFLPGLQEVRQATVHFLQTGKFP